MPLLVLWGRRSGQGSGYDVLAVWREHATAVRGQAAPDPGPPQALNATLEFDLDAGAIVARQWTRHPLCSC